MVNTTAGNDKFWNCTVKVFKDADIAYQEQVALGSSYRIVRRLVN